MKSSSEIFNLRVGRSWLVKVAPLLLWFLAFFMPVFVGRYIYLDSTARQHEQAVASARHQLMTKAREIEGMLNPEKIIRENLALSQLERAYSYFFNSGDMSLLQKNSLIKNLPNFDRDINDELKKFSHWLLQNARIKPFFILVTDEDPAKCALYIDEEKADSERFLALYASEFSRICRFLNERSQYLLDEPDTYHYLEKIAFFRDFFGIFHYFNSHFWRVDSCFAGHYNEHLYLVTMRPPAAKGSGKNILVGILISRLSQRAILQHICRVTSTDEIRVSFGTAKSRELPIFYADRDSLSLTVDLPDTFRMLFRSGVAENKDNKFVLHLEISNKGNPQHCGSVLLNLAQYLLLAVTFLLAAGMAMGRFGHGGSLARVVMIAFFAGMFPALAGFAWLGVSYAQVSHDIEAQRVIQAIRQKLKEGEIAFELQRNRQQLFMAYLARVFQGMSTDRWGDYVRRFFADDSKSTFKAHFCNFYLFSDLGREYFRGQSPGENFRRNELPNTFAGPARHLMVQAGAFEHLSAAERQRISQVADFSSGVTEELVEKPLLSRLLGSAGQPVNASVLTRKFIHIVYFLKSAHKMVGFLCMVTQNTMTAAIIDELNALGSFKKHFELNGYKVDLEFFPISDFHERQLLELLEPEIRKSPLAISIDTANALYVNSDASQVNNLHLQPPHILVSETIMEQSIFAVARATAPENSNSALSASLLLVVLALFACFVLATGVAMFLLAPIPPFIAVFKELENNRYDWKLNLQTGDEFDALAASVNSMKVSLLERQKIMQLVSQTAIEAARSDVNIKKQPERQKASILFCDIRGFTTISENNSAEEVVDMLNSYFTGLCPAIEKNGGFIDKLIGDAIQAVFLGESDTGRVMNAASAAVEMRKRLAGFNAARAQQNLFVVDNGIGIASGYITTGLVGSKTGKLEAAVMGEPLQRAAHLESLSKLASKTFIIIDSASRSALVEFSKTERLVVADNAALNDPIYELIEIYS